MKHLTLALCLAAAATPAFAYVSPGQADASMHSLNGVAALVVIVAGGIWFFARRKKV